MRPSPRGVLAAMNLVSFMALTARGDEKAIELKDLPATVRQSAEKAVAGAKWNEAVRDTGEDATIYRLRGTEAKGCKVEVTLSAEGKVEAVETTSSLRDLKELPVEVRKAAESAAPGAKWTEVVIRTEEAATTYRLKGTDAKGLGVEATLKAEVHIEVVETALDLKELPKPLADVLRPLAGAKWTRAVMKAGEEETTYEADGADSKGHELTVTVEEGGRSTVRTELQVFDVPSVVIDALKARRPTFRPDSVALVDAQGSVAYEFDGKEDGKGITLSVTLDGKTITVVNDDDDED